MKLHERVRNRREGKGITQQEWAAKAKVHRTQVQQLENGANLTLKSVEKLLDALNLNLVVVSPEELRSARQHLAVLLVNLTALSLARSTVEKLLESLGVVIPVLQKQSVDLMLRDLEIADAYLLKIEQDVNIHLAYTETFDVPAEEDEAEDDEPPPSPPRKRVSRARKRA